MFGRKKSALVVFHSKTGHTAEAAEAVARGLESRRVATTVKRVGEVSPDEVSGYSVIAVGSPTRGAKPARVVKRFLKGLDKKALKGKTATTFSSYAGFRGKATLRRMKKQLKRRKAKVLPGVAFKAGAPLSLWKGPQADEKDIARLEGLGRKLAKKA